MAKLILEMQISIDGYLATQKGETDWMIWNWGPNWTWDKKLQDFHTDLTLSATHLLISRQMAEEGFMLHWRNIAERQSALGRFAGHLAKTPKTVMSSSLRKDRPIPGGWENAYISNELVASVTRLKKNESGNILVYGGARLVSSLLKQHLIDELYLLINPVAIGSGMTAFNDRQFFRLEGAQSYPCGVTVLHYLLGA